MLEQLGRLEEAVASYDKAVEIQPDNPLIFYNKACCYALQNNIDLAIENLQQAISLNPKKYKKMAETSSDFDNIRYNTHFKKLSRGRFISKKMES